MGALISLFISLFMMLVSLTISLTMTMFNLLVALATRSIPRSRPRGARRPSSVGTRQGGSTGRIALIVIALLIALVIDVRLALVLALVLLIAWLVRRHSRHGPAVEQGELSRLYQGVSLMSGAQFEAFMATLFRAMGHEVTVLGGAGDQGVDILITTADKQRVAVQCKNYNKPVGNTPVQEVFAGAKHYRCDHAWVVAPRGYTRGAIELAKSIGVSLFDDTGIRAWIKEVDMKIASQQAQQEEGATAQASAAPDLERDREEYDKLLQNYDENLDVLENLYKHKREHAHPFNTDPSLSEQWSNTYEKLDANIKNALTKMDLLEGRNPELATEERVARRAELNSRHMELENTYSLQEVDLRERNSPKMRTWQIQPSPQKRRTGDLGADSAGQKEDASTDSNMEKHTISVGTDTIGETVSFTAKLLGTAHVNGGKEVEGGMDWTYYRLPDNTYRVLIDDGNTTLLLPSNFTEALGRGEPAEYGSWTLKELQAQGEYGRIFDLLMEKHPEGKKRNVRDLD